MLRSFVDMANRNECFSDFSKRKTVKERWHSLVSRMGDRQEYSSSPRVCTDVRSLARSHADVITKFSRLDRLPIFLTHGASLARFARWSSAINCPLSIDTCCLTIIQLQSEKLEITSHLRGFPSRKIRARAGFNKLLTNYIAKGILINGVNDKSIV